MLISHYTIYMRTLLLLLIIPLFMFSCKGDEMKPEQVALQTAKTYYDQLLNGDVASFVSGVYMKDSVVSSYREQLETNMEWFLEQQKKEHGGIIEVKTINAVSEKEHFADAFLLFCFGDSTKEQVVVPMIEVDGIWMMR